MLAYQQAAAAQQRAALQTKEVRASAAIPADRLDALLRQALVASVLVLQAPKLRAPTPSAVLRLPTPSAVLQSPTPSAVVRLPTT